MSLEDDIENLRDIIDDAEDVLHNILGNTEQEEIDKCNGYIESICGRLSQAKEDADFSIYLYKGN